MQAKYNENKSWKSVNVSILATKIVNNNKEKFTLEQKYIDELKPSLNLINSFKKN